MHRYVDIEYMPPTTNRAGMSRC